VKKSNYQRAQHMRELLWDYVLILANTGIRTGKEALNLKWNQIRWHTDKTKQKYLAITVSGKTAKRELVARHACHEFLKRIQSRFPELAKMTFDELIKARVDQYVFRLRTGKRTNNLRKTFFDFLVEHDLLKDATGQDRTLYSLRHLYATFRIADGDVTAHQLAKQMGTSEKMLELHYSHFEPVMIAEKLAGKRYEKKSK
jgi:integrase